MAIEQGALGNCATCRYRHQELTWTKVDTGAFMGSRTLHCTNFLPEATEPVVDIGGTPAVLIGENISEPACRAGIVPRTFCGIPSPKAERDDSGIRKF